MSPLSRRLGLLFFVAAILLLAALFFTPARAQSPVPLQTQTGKNLDVPTGQAQDTHSYIRKPHVAILCTVETGPNAGSGFQTIPIAPGQKPADLCSNVAGFRYDRLPIGAGIPLPGIQLHPASGHPP